MVYISLFTVHVYSEMLEARNVVGPEAFPTTVNATVTITDSGA